MVPVFYVEVFGNLAKADPKGRDADLVVGDLADKTPVYDTTVSVFAKALQRRLVEDQDRTLRPP